jgi:hypothetical protein
VGSSEARAHRDAAREHVGKGQFAEALDEADKALSLEPESAATHTLRAVALSRLGRGEESLEAFREALRHEPQSARSHFNLASQLNVVGRREEALQHALEAQRLDPGLANLSRLLEQLGGAAPQPPGPPEPRPVPPAPPPEPSAASWDPLKRPEPPAGPPQPPAPAASPRYGVAPPTAAPSYESGLGPETFVPPEVKRWNFGAFFLAPLWALFMRLYAVGWGVLALHVLWYVVIAVGVARIAGPAAEILAQAGTADAASQAGAQELLYSKMGWTSLVAEALGLVILVAHIWLGVAGSAMAWKARRFDGVMHFFDVQRVWMYWGIGLFALSFCLTCGSMIASLVAIGAAAAQGIAP